MFWMTELSGALLVVLALSPPVQAQEPPSPILTVLKQVAADPTTYAPAIVSFTAERLDWASSQVFFEHGYVEQNPQFTISGRPGDIPLGYGAGNRVITMNALADLRSSALNNLTTRAVERLLLTRYPHRQKMIRTMGWIERISFATMLAYTQSSRHFEQWRHNTQVARELGYR
jgi:hypothetical protein